MERVKDILADIIIWVFLFSLCATFFCAIIAHVLSASGMTGAASIVAMFGIIGMVITILSAIIMIAFD